MKADFSRLNEIFNIHNDIHIFIFIFIFFIHNFILILNNFVLGSNKSLFIVKVE